MTADRHPNGTRYRGAQDQPFPSSPAARLDPLLIGGLYSAGNRTTWSPRRVGTLAPGPESGGGTSVALRKGPLTAANPAARPASGSARRRIVRIRQPSPQGRDPARAGAMSPGHQEQAAVDRIPRSGLEFLHRQAPRVRSIRAGAPPRFVSPRKQRLRGAQR